MQIVAIVGRPNVGKSSFFKKLTGKKEIIVDEKAGVTRDRLYAEMSFEDKKFLLVDTGGFEPSGKEVIKDLILRQTEAAIDEADLLIVLFDGKAGVHPDDSLLVERLRKSKKKVIYAVNKTDSSVSQQNKFEFFSLGIEKFHHISAIHGSGVKDLLDELAAKLDKFDEAEAKEEGESFGLAVIGRPNVGKSSLVNKILNYERVMVHDKPGTTRDAVDTFFKYDSTNYLLIDTAGIRRRSKIDDNLEARSVFSALKSIDRAKAIILVVDSSKEIAVQDLRISNYAFEKGKALLVLVNKMDLIEDYKDIDYENFKKKLLNLYPSLSFCPFLFASVKLGFNMDKVMKTVKEVSKNFSMKIETKVLNQYMKEIAVNEKLGYVKGKRGVKAKIKYVTQKGVEPPKFVFFCNYPVQIKEKHRIFLINKLREKFKFTGVPIFASFRKE